MQVKKMEMKFEIKKSSFWNNNFKAMPQNQNSCFVDVDQKDQPAIWDVVTLRGGLYR